MDTPTPHEQVPPDAPGPAENLALEMQDVTVGSMKFTRQPMLEEVNWTVRVGDFWAIAGLQATGKSDLLSTAVGLMRPLHGTVRVFGHELGTGYIYDLLQTRLRIGLVFDGGRLLRHLTVAENILLPLRYHQNPGVAEQEQQLRALLEMTGLLHHAQSYPSMLSLNWQQRVGLARALTLKPELLLLDNPLTGLDPLHGSWWLRTLDQLANGHPILDQRPVTLVVTGDDLRPWKGHARQFAVLKDRHFIAVATGPNGMPEEGLLNEWLGIERKTA